MTTTTMTMIDALLAELDDSGRELGVALTDEAGRVGAEHFTARGQKPELVHLERLGELRNAKADGESPGREVPRSETDLRLVDERVVRTA